MELSADLVSARPCTSSALAQGIALEANLCPRTGRQGLSDRVQHSSGGDGLVDADAARSVEFDHLEEILELLWDHPLEAPVEFRGKHCVRERVAVRCQQIHALPGHLDLEGALGAVELSQQHQPTPLPLQHHPPTTK